MKLKRALLTRVVCYGYSIFLARHQIRHANPMGRHSGLRRAITSRLFCALLLDKHTLRDTLLALDPDEDGRVSVDELHEVLSNVLPGLSRKQAWVLLRTSGAAGASSVWLEREVC